MLIKRRKHSVPSLNTTSTADISFMLLTFFLVTSSMDVDKGLVRQLPPLDKEEQTDEAKDVSKENTLSFSITAQNEVMLNDKPVAVADIRRRIVDFVRMRGAQHLILVDANPASDYNTYFTLENEIVAAYAEVRNAEAKRRYHRDYASCTDGQRKKVRDIYPQHLSETYNTAEVNNSSEDNKTSKAVDEKKGGAE